MGFDLIGVKPIDKKGEFFKNDVWWWRQLWNYVNNVCSDILSDNQFDGGHFNEGTYVSEDQCKRIAIRLRKELDAGYVKMFEKEYEKQLKDLQDVDCGLCKGTGQRNDERIQGKCNLCNGTGKRRPDDCSYPFSEANLKKFVEFIEVSGGFRIYKNKL